MSECKLTINMVQGGQVSLPECPPGPNCSHSKQSENCCWGMSQNAEGPLHLHTPLLQSPLYPTLTHEETIEHKEAYRLTINMSTFWICKQRVFHIHKHILGWHKISTLSWLLMLWVHKLPIASGWKHPCRCTSLCPITPLRVVPIHITCDFHLQSCKLAIITHPMTSF